VNNEQSLGLGRERQNQSQTVQKNSTSYNKSSNDNMTPSTPITKCLYKATSKIQNLSNTTEKFHCAPCSTVPRSPWYYIIGDIAISITILLVITLPVINAITLLVTVITL